MGQTPEKGQMSIRKLKLEVRKSLSRCGFPLPIEEIARLHLISGHSPLVVTAVSEAEIEKKKIGWKPWEVAFLKSHTYLSNEELAFLLRRGQESIKGKKFCLKKAEQKESKGGQENGDPQM